MVSFSLANEVTIVTGACGGLAHTLLQELLQHGAPLALFDRNEDALRVTRTQLQQYATDELSLKPDAVPAIHVYACDIADSVAVHAAVNRIEADFGTPATHLVNTAGYCENFPAEEYPAANAEALMRVNLLGSLYIAQAFAKPLIAKGIRDASIVMVGSMSGIIVNDPQPQIAYNMSKAGVIHMVRSLAVEWAKYGIRVNTLSPGYIATPLTKNVINGNADLYNRWMAMVPQGRMSEPQEYSGTVIYLLCNSASSYTTGENIVVDGGYQCW